jgi:hypothetical protein
MDQLPPPDAAARRALLARLTAAPPGQEAWECGGMTNFTIAAARLGLRTGAVGHLGADVYGAYMERVLRVSTAAGCRPCSRHFPGMWPSSPPGRPVPGGNRNAGGGGGGRAGTI